MDVSQRMSLFFSLSLTHMINYKILGKNNPTIKATDDYNDLLHSSAISITHYEDEGEEGNESEREGMKVNLEWKQKWCFKLNGRRKCVDEKRNLSPEWKMGGKRKREKRKKNAEENEYVMS